MKSVREVYNEICNSEELQAGLKAAQLSSTVGDFLIGLGCTNINEIMLDFYRKGSRCQALNLDELDDVVGGTGRNGTAEREAAEGVELEQLTDVQMINKLFNQVL